VIEKNINLVAAPDMRQIAPTLANILHVSLKEAELGPVPLQ